MSSERSVLYLDDFLVLDSSMCGMTFDPQEFYELDNTHGFTELIDKRLFQTVVRTDDISDLPIHPREIRRQIGSGDMYKPRKVRGVGRLREGCCGICNSWFKLKTSSYWYHMNYKHGISSKGIKYPEPQIRYTGDKVDGFCMICDEWITLGYKSNRKSTRFGWFRHCQKKHGSGKAI
ncbi:hypothetical protein EROM_030250 [Encephalitozoon romaleae SJ-2008]|uniref:Transcription regulator Rua1 C-terminal domain-containing protein n=1 Tax=Encephalitozoon romaleae (strain SJ-2008) TaxID=1178016 RepID=I7ADK7_ENCRO|nr:hypothetical protein EROM_030250 [Encephalitozoon romaleae SJ-2008]AFN82645.1 hypothetical protein EROM_030250 [Encephalitozoon romaleae SJ-2008]